jgi:xanthine dehydrogenase/oxidase
METIIEHVASALKIDPLEVRLANLYKKGDITPVLQPLVYFNADIIIDQLRESSEYEKRRSEIKTFNEANRWKKRGISLVPMKWGAGMQGNFNCMISIYAADGSVSLSGGGIEIGQGFNTKITQVCAYALQIPMDLISNKYTDTNTNPNAAPTGGSRTTEQMAYAVMQCCAIINKRLEPVREQMPAGYTWQQLILRAAVQGVDLSARFNENRQQTTPFVYEVYAAACSEAIVDVLTGETQILRTDILYDCGQCLNGTIDIGQAEGAFVMGMGFWLHEKVMYDPDSGLNLTNGTWEYKPPSSKDIPVDFRVSFLRNSPNPLGFLGAKAVGEPPLCLAPSVAFAAKRAIEAARAEINNSTYFALNSPATVDAIQQLCLVDYKQFALN